MELLDIANHLLNFVAPALFVALLLALAGRVVRGRGALVGGFWRGLWRSVWVNALLGSAVLTAGLIGFGNDGKMLTYAALVLVCASAQWALDHGWRDRN